MSEELVALTFFAANHALASIKRGGTLATFTLSETNSGKRRLMRFLDATIEETVDHARAAIQELPPGTARAVTAYDGFITLDETRSDAIMLEAQERNSGRCLTFAQRYEPGRLLRPLRGIGNLALVGDETATWV